MSKPHRSRTRMAFALSLALCTGAAFAQAAPEVSLTRLDCGGPAEPRPLASFNDAFALEDFKLQLVYSCYLIRHGDDYMVWDTGNALNGRPEAPKTSLVDQLTQLKVAPAQVKYVGISHHHNDHIGQAGAFGTATLLIGKGDWDVLRATEPPPGMTAEDLEKRRAPFATWIAGTARVDTLTGDRKDVFGDGRVVMLSLPGHTPGHHGLLVRLKQTGNVLLTGDATHFHENYALDGVPTWNHNRADTLASLDRFKKIAKALDATVIIQHDPRDVAKLPAFPEAAK